MARYWNKRRKRWIAQVTHEGYRASKACRSVKEAKDAEVDILKDLKAQVASERAEEQGPATLRLLCETYQLDLERRGKAADSVTRAKDTKKRLEEVFGKKRMDEPLTRLTEADIYAFRAERLRQWAKKGKKQDQEQEKKKEVRGVKPSTINRDLRTLRAMLKKALPGFRFPAGAFLKEDETRVRWLEPIQEVDVMSRLRSPFDRMCRLANLTLMRLSEIRTLRREHVALSQGVVTLVKTKAQEPQAVVLSGEARDILQKQLDSHRSDWVFPGPSGRPYSRVHVSREWRRAAKAAGLTDFHFHDLRHDGATKALNAGFSAPIVMSLGRWKTERMMRRYAAVTDKTLRAAAEAVSGNVAPKIQTLASANVQTEGANR